MTANAFRIEPINLRATSAREYAALNAFGNRMRAERLPDDPPLSLEEDVLGWRNMPALIEAANWSAWSGDDIVAGAGAHFHRTTENQHVLDFNVEVLPEFRRRGLARALLSHIAAFAQQQNRRLLIGVTNERVPAGVAFMERLGGRRGLDESTNQLRVEEVDRGLLRRWIRNARTDEFELGWWEGPVPDDNVEAVCNLIDVMNTAPRGSLEVEDFHVTPEMLRQWEKSDLDRGNVNWTIYTRDRATGEFAGFTDVCWNPLRPWLLQQRGTGTFPKFRNRGLGRWMKAAMLDRVLRDRPEVKFVRTGNADINAPMLKINYELGFKPYLSKCVWQVETEKVQEYLSG